MNGEAQGVVVYYTVFGDSDDYRVDKVATLPQSVLAAHGLASSAMLLNNEEYWIDRDAVCEAEGFDFAAYGAEHLAGVAEWVHPAVRHVGGDSEDSDSDSDADADADELVSIYLTVMHNGRRIGEIVGLQVRESAFYVKRDGTIRYRHEGHEYRANYPEHGLGEFHRAATAEEGAAAAAAE